MRRLHCTEGKPYKTTSYRVQGIRSLLDVFIIVKRRNLFCRGFVFSNFYRFLKGFKITNLKTANVANLRLIWYCFFCKTVLYKIGEIDAILRNRHFLKFCLFQCLERLQSNKLTIVRNNKNILKKINLVKKSLKKNKSFAYI